MSRLLLRSACIVLALAALLPARAPARAQSAATERLILTPQGDTTFRLQVVYPNEGVTCEAKRRRDLRARYRGRLEIIRRGDGSLSIIDHVTFDQYLRGISEVPRSWPLETLKAQAVAARTYALYQLAHPRESARALGYDICSTDQCQVYRGASVEQGAFGEQWVRAVAETRGRVLRYRGEVIQAFYHSTSPGRTKRSFPGGTPLPYLPSVPGRDEDSPIARWTVRVPLADLGPILDAAGDWPGGRITSVRLSGDGVRLAGPGRTETISKSSFRSALNGEAACVFPDRYPTRGPSGAKLPQTVPSIDFSMTQSGDAVEMAGRGWGHAVGMSQYGAKALAEEGRTYDEILGYFYGGAKPEAVAEPGLIRVLVAEDATLVRVAVEGTATVTTSTGSTLAPGERFDVRGGRALDVRRATGPSFTPVLTVELAAAGPVVVPAAGAATVAYTLSGSARVALVVLAGGSEVLRTPEVSQTSGANALAFSLGATPPPAPTPSGATAAPTPSVVATPTLAPGSYELVLEAYDGLDRVRTAPVAITVRAPEAASPRPGAPGGGSSPAALVAGAAALVALAGGILVRRARRARAGDGGAGAHSGDAGST